MTAFTTLPFCTCPSGAASFTLAVITSPNPARSPVAPPSSRIICSLRAPELSATSSMVLIITAMFVSSLCPLPARGRVNVGGDLRHQGRLAHNLFQRPPLQPRERARFLDAHHIAEMRFIFLVVRVELLADRDHAAVECMRLLARHFDHDRLLHLVRHDRTDQMLAARLLFRACSFRHGYFFSVLRAASSCSRRMVFTRAMSLRNPRIFFRLSVCPIFIWNFSLNS